MKKKFLKRLVPVVMLTFALCLGKDVYAEEITQPTEEDVYIHYNNEENTYTRAIVVDRVVYQYLPEQDCYRIVAFDDNEEDFPEGVVIKPRSEVRGKPVTGIHIDGEEDGPSSLSKINLVLPDSVKNINISGTFFGSVTFPESFDMEQGAVYESTLEQIYFPAGVRTVAGIWEIDTLEKVELPSSVKKIGKYFLQDSPDLRSVYIPEGVTTVGTDAFSGCSKLEVFVPKSVRKIGKGAFHNVKKLYCVKNSAAYNYAKKYHISCETVNPVKASYKARDLTLDTKQISMPVSARKRILYQVTPFYAANRSVRFSSSNPKVVSVNARGILKAKKNGKATITVQLKSGSKKKEKLTVIVQPQAPAYFSADESKNKIRFSWKKSENALGYEISCADSKNGTYKVIKKLNGETTSIRFKASNKKYYKIRARYKTAKGKKYYSAYSDAVYDIGNGFWVRN